MKDGVPDTPLAQPARWPMQPNLLLRGGLSVLAGLVWAAGGFAQSPATTRPDVAVAAYTERSPARTRVSGPAPLAVVAPAWRERVAKVVQQPTLTAHGPAEEFRANLYDWLLEHPDRVALAWRRLGVPCVGISDLGDGRFGWTDGQGSELNWWTVGLAPGVRIWYAEGRVKGGAMLPVVPARAVAVLRHARRLSAEGRAVVVHEVDVYLQTDSKAAALVTRLLGPAAPRLAEQGAQQLLLFFSAMAKYLDRHPDEVQTLLAP